MALADAFIFDNGGTRRSCSTEDTMARLKPLLARFGITRVANITGLDRIGIPVAIAIRPSSRSLVVSQGKGATLIDAKVSAIMESIELYHAERPALPVTIASQRNLRAEVTAILDCGRMPCTRDREFDEMAVIGWTQGQDLACGCPCWVPFAYVAVDDTIAALPIPDGIPVNSNGLASGNSLDEAIIHALCELVERDSIALWHLANDDDRQKRSVDLSTIDDPHCRALLTRYDHADIDVHIFDLTSDIGLPVYEVFIRENGQNGHRDAFSAVGSGCHAWRGIALSRALTEAAQCRLTHIAGAREDLVQADYATMSKRMKQVEHYLHLAERPSRSFRPDNVPEPDSYEAFPRTLARIIGTLRKSGLDQVVMVDLSIEDGGLHVVRLLVPGLEGLVFEAGYRPGFRGRRVIESRDTRT